MNVRLVFLLLTSLLFKVPAVCGQVWIPSRIVGLEYPRLALQSRTQGTVKVRCLVDKTGSVTSAETIEVVSSQKAAREILGKAAKENASIWRFAKTELATSSLSSDGAILVYTFRIVDGLETSVNPKFVFEYPNTVLVESEAKPIRWTPAYKQ